MKYNIAVFLNNTQIFAKASLTTNFFDRLKGLLGTKEINNDSPLIINSCSSVHTFFMNYPIGVIYLNSKGRVLDSEILPPNRLGKMRWSTRSVIECSPEMFDLIRFMPGDIITF